MNLRSCVDTYIEYRQSLGSQFRAESDVLKVFLKRVGENTECDAITREDIVVFLQSIGRLTATRALRYSVLTGFYRYAVSRDYVACSPLPAPEEEPPKPESKTPYIYTREELRRLVDTIPSSRRHAFRFDASTMRMLIFLVYGAGLRGGEARGLRMRDVDLSKSEITVADSKFGKTRRLPVGAQLANELRAYMELRARRPLPDRTGSFFLATVDGKWLSRKTVGVAFQNLLRDAEICHTDPMTQPPGLHSFRHTFAVDRLTAWYREGADVQRLLPKLSAYLGHVNLASTEVYLTMTEELLSQASGRFERYARGDGHA